MTNYTDLTDKIRRAKATLETATSRHQVVKAMNYLTRLQKTEKRVVAYQNFEYLNY